MNYLERKATNNAIQVLQQSLNQAARAKEAEKVEAERKRREAENEKLAEKFRVEREKEKQVEAERKRKEMAARLEQYLRESFFKNNPEATDADFRNLLPDLKKQHFLDRMKAEKSLEEKFSAEMPKM